MMASWDNGRERAQMQDVVQDDEWRIPHSVVMRSPRVERTGGACHVVSAVWREVVAWHGGRVLRQNQTVS